MPAGLGWRLGLAAVIILISVVAGRIVPSFTRNRLAKRGASDFPPSHGVVDRLALCVLHLGLVGWVFDLAPSYVGVVLLFGTALNLRRLSRWRGIATGAEPLLAILHIAYGWLVVGAALLGLTQFGANVPLSAAIHALTVGAIGTMILAVMPRVTLGPTGRALTANRTTSLSFLGLAALVRLAAAFVVEWSMPLLIVSACFWIAGFGLFGLNYGPLLIKPGDTRW